MTILRERRVVDDASRSANPTFIVFQQSCGVFITGSTDAAIKVFDVNNWESSSLLVAWDSHTEPITALCVEGCYLASGSEDSSVRLFHLESKQHIRLLSRLAQPVRCVALDQPARYVAIASEESTIRIVNVEDIQDCASLVGHDGPVMAVAWSLDGTHLASAGTDRSLRIWHRDGTVKQSWPSIWSRDFVRHDSKFSLQYVIFKGLEYLVFPTEGGLQWMTAEHELKCILKIPNMQLPRLFAFNADRSCLCVADPAMAVVVVRLGDQPGAVAEVRALKHPRPVTDLAWVSGTSVAVADDGGVVGLWEDAAPAAGLNSESPPAAAAACPAAPEEEEEEDLAIPKKAVPVLPKGGPPTDAEAADAKKVASASQPKAKKAKKTTPAKSKVKQASQKEDSTGEGEGEGEGEEESCPYLAKVEEDEEEDEEETDPEMEEDLDEEEAAMVEGVRRAGYGAYEGGERLVDADDGAEEVRRPAADPAVVIPDEFDAASDAAEDDDDQEVLAAPRVLLQEAFQTTSIPDLEGTGISVLACNVYGVVKLHAGEEGHPAVIITPSDQGKYKPARIAGHFVHLAALGKVGAVLACKNAESSYIMFKALDTWASNSSWNLHFPPGEDIVGLGINSKYVAVFTTRFMRVFTASGLETAVVSFPHRFVTCAGCEKYLMAVVCDDGGTEMKCSVYDLHARTAVHQLLPVALSPGTHLLWLGWSDDAVLSTCDTLGVVRCLHHDFGCQWIPMYDPLTRSDRMKYWPTGLDRAKLYGLPCKQGTNYPPSSADLSVPLSAELMIPLTTTEKVEYRERYLRTLYKAETLKRNATVYTADIQEVDKEMDRYSYALFEAALDKDQTQRAFDCAACFNFRSTYEQAMKKAHSKGHTALLKGMAEVLNRRFSKCRRLCQLPDPGQKERKKELQEKKLQEKIQRIVPAPLGPAPAPAGGPAAETLPEDTDETQLEEDDARAGSPPQLHSPAPADVAKQLFASQPREAESLGSQKKAKAPPSEAAKATDGGGSPFVCFSPNSKLQSTPGSLTAAMSTLASMSQPAAARSLLAGRLNTALSPPSLPASVPVRASSTPQGNGTVPPTTPASATGRGSAENKLTASRFVRNPGHRYPPPTAGQPAGLPAPSPSPIPSPSPSQPRPAPVEPPKKERVVTPGVSSELGRAAFSALKKRQLDDDAEEAVDVPALKVSRTGP